MTSEDACFSFWLIACCLAAWASHMLWMWLRRRIAN